MIVVRSLCVLLELLRKNTLITRKLLLLAENRDVVTTLRRKKCPSYIRIEQKK